MVYRRTLSMVSAGIIACAGSSPALSQTVPAAPAQPTGQVNAPASDAGSDIIVTGTRQSGITAAESATPIKLINAESISHTSTSNLNNVLTTLLPSFTAQAFGYDTAATTLSAKLRGVSPNHTLILINGKRRHGTANLQVYAGPFQGGIAPDLDYITPASIDHVEVLEDGAAAQYGSDAVAGVINVILKKGAGGSFSATGGEYYAGDGPTYSSSLNYGVKSDSAFLNFTGFYRYHGHSARGGADLRVANPDGSLVAGLSPKRADAYRNLLGYPNVNPYNGDARTSMGVLSYNAGFDIGASVKAYSFGTLGVREAELRQNVRLPDRIVASPALGIAGSFDDPTSLIFAPRGFIPIVENKELDYASTLGIEGELAEWHWDLSTTYGRDRAKIGQYNSANSSLFIDTHQTPTSFHDGTFIAKEWTNNLDITRKLSDLGTLAFGAEYRENTYSIGAGDAASRYKEGSQSYPGFQLTDAGTHSRHNYAVYGDLALNPLTGLKLDGAVRYEDYSDFGSAVTWKANGRYDLSPAVGLRGTVATGFRAPSLAEEYYSATTTAPFFANAQLPSNSNAAKLLGIPNLRPEKSTSYSAGLVLHPERRLTITVDAYQINIRDRIANSGVIKGTGTRVINGVPTNVAISPEVLAAIAANGNVLDPRVSDTGVQVFSNALSTRTRGVDLVGSYLNDFDSLGRVNWTVSANYNATKVTKVNPVPGPIARSGQAVIDPVALSFLETASPKYKVILGADWTIGKFGVTLRETFYGKTHVFNTEDGVEFTNNSIKATGITDLEVYYRLRSNVTLAAGAQNLFNKQPETDRLNSRGDLSDGFAVYDAPLGFSPYGINGGYWYGRMTISF